MELRTVKSIIADVSAPNAPQHILAKQGDAGSRFLRVTVTDAGEACAVPLGTQVALNIRRPDGEARSYSGTVEEAGTLFFPLPNWALALAGQIACDVSLLTPKEKLTTAQFFICVEETSSEGELREDEEIVDRVQEVLAKLERIDGFVSAATEAADAASAAKGDAARAAEEAKQAASRAAAEVNASLSDTLQKAQGAAEEAKQAASRAAEAAETQAEGVLSAHTEDPAAHGIDARLSEMRSALKQDVLEAVQIPARLADLEEDAEHRTVTDAEKAAWNDDWKARLLQAVYPIGSIYLSVSPTSPAEFLGGVWERIQDRFLLAAGMNYAAGKKGGAATHSHSISLRFGDVYGVPQMNEGETGLYNYRTQKWGTSYANGSATTVSGEISKSNASKSLSARRSDGTTSVDSGLPPYLSVYVWQRTE